MFRKEFLLFNLLYSIWWVMAIFIVQQVLDFRKTLKSILSTKKESNVHFVEWMISFIIQCVGIYALFYIGVIINEDRMWIMHKYWSYQWKWDIYHSYNDQRISYIHFKFVLLISIKLYGLYVQQRIPLFLSCYSNIDFM